MEPPPPRPPRERRGSRPSAERLVIDERGRPVSAPNEYSGRRLVLDCSGGSTASSGSTAGRPPRATSAKTSKDGKRANTATPRKHRNKAEALNGLGLAPSSSEQTVLEPTSARQQPPPQGAVAEQAAPEHGDMIQWTEAKQGPQADTSPDGVQFRPARESVPASEATQAKVATCSQYLEEYWQKLATYRQARTRRETKLQTRLEAQPDADAREAELNQHKLKETIYLRGLRTKLSREDFNLKCRLGEGNYGKVFLASKKDTGEIIALKVLNKAGMETKNRWRRARAEREVLASGLSRWFVRLAYSFQDKEHLYLCMEFVPGGDLRSMLENIGSMNEAHARFYIAEMVTCVTGLHHLGFIHRDLKPANFLVDSGGHLKLTDFGLSKKAVAGFVLHGSCEVDPMDLPDGAPEGTQPPQGGFIDVRALQRADSKDKDLSATAAAAAKAYSCVGSPDYMAPEMLQGKGYDESVDFWSLGCIAYELLVGWPPFHRDTREGTFHAILQWQSHRPIMGSATPSGVALDPLAADLINRLVCGPKERLGNPRLPVQSHPFLAGFAWKELTEEPPFVPRLVSKYDTTYFPAVPCSSFEEELGSPPKMTPRGSTHFTSPPEQTAFAGYSFKKFPSTVGGGMQEMMKDVQKMVKAKEAKDLAAVAANATAPECKAVAREGVTGNQVVCGADDAEEVEDDEEESPAPEDPSG